ncbi:2-amino-4-hydroxy-6-hydroxymethyldihydropteridine diphosphokinase [Halomonas halocynthiae]|uniref:2-amino-4-hydroxy-6- hydroxymethyldihydropteridine diphosphokinase n=1 Tax=Halomonas halocynthiae TaxID=176290 RepID=UPI0004202AB1|nr:2-amino-4-hydroxy-6-hydroxymethyldihydropteridine diphosphokinase [Halomonas halocynthiae]
MTLSLAWIGLGSNIDGPHEHIERAFRALDQLPLTRCQQQSSRYRSRPVGPADQPDFVNAVAQLETRLSPLALLDQLQALEQQHGRVRQRHWGPRTLDLDLLLFDDRQLSTPRLTVPHAHMHQRGFVLIPLAELVPDLRLPNGKRIDELLATLDTSDLQRVLPKNTLTPQ